MGCRYYPSHLCVFRTSTYRSTSQLGLSCKRALKVRLLLITDLQTCPSILWHHASLPATLELYKRAYQSMCINSSYSNIRFVTFVSRRSSSLCLLGRTYPSPGLLQKDQIYILSKGQLETNKWCSFYSVLKMSATVASLKMMSN